MNSPDRNLFEIPREVTYLNTASCGPRLKSVSEAAQNSVDFSSRPWNFSTDDWFGPPNKLRRLVAQFIGTDSNSVALVPSASYGIAIAAKNLPVAAHQNIIVLEEQFPSNIYAWKRRAKETGASIRVAERSEDLRLTDSILSQIDVNTAIVAIPNCHWTDGEWIDLVAVGEAARAMGAALVVDASQSLGVIPIDLDAVQPDFVISVGYKWFLCPYGLSFLYSSKKWQAEGIPLEETWLVRQGSENFSNLVEYTDDYKPGALRFDFGEYPQFIAIPMAIAALSQMNVWGPSYLQIELSKRTKRVRELCQMLDLKTVPAEHSVGHILGFQMPQGQNPAKLAQVLKAANIHVGVRSDKIRIAPHLHTDEQDLDRFCSVLEEQFRK